MGDFSRDPETVLQDALAKNYSRVRFQQGKPLLDRELNLLADLASPQRFAQANFGNGIRGEGADFLITGLNVPTNDFSIIAGTCLLNGYEVVLLADTTYKTQPRNQNVAALPAGLSNVYLKLFIAEANGAQDAGLLNGNDVGSETSIREKADWEVLVTTQTINTRDHFLLASINTAGPAIADRRRKGLNVSTIRDEVSNARGAAAQLAARLDASLAPAGSLKPNVVGNAQILDNAIGPNKLADGSVAGTKLTDNSVSTQKIAANGVGTAQLADNAVIATKIANGVVGTTKLAPAAVTEPIMANNAASNRTIVNGSVTIEKLSAKEIVIPPVTLVAAPVGGRTEQVVTLLETDGQAFFLISVHIDEPRTSGLAGFNRTVDWKYRVSLQKPPLLAAFRHFHQLVIEHTNNVDMKVTVRAFRLGES